jgi:DNA polymerase family A
VPHNRSVRVAVVPGPGRSGVLCALGPDEHARPGPASASPGLAGEPALVADLAAAVREREQAGDVRWVWPATAEVYPALLRAGVRVGRCHDVALTEGLLLARAGTSGAPASLAAAAARLHGRPVPAAVPAAGHAARAVIRGAPQQSLFDDSGAGPGGPEAEAALTAALGDLIAVHAAQLAGIGADEHPGRLALLAAAESAGGLAAAEMTAAGLPWRPDEHDRLLAGLLGPRPPASPRGGPAAVPARLADLAARISAAFGTGAPVNPDSPAQVVRALAGEGIQVSSTRLAVLRDISHPAIPLLLEYKELSRLHAAFGWSWLDTWVTGGRFRPEYVVGGVVSGRWASRGGGALQIPRMLRKAVVADPGWVLVVADAAQLEPRILAALAGDEAFAEAAAAGDLYEALAGEFGGERRLAKVALLSAMYGGSGGEAGQLLAVLRRRFPRASAFVEAAAQAGEEGRTVRSVLGRTCPPPSAAWRSLTSDTGDPDADRDPGAGRAARSRGRFTRNFVVQASAADWALVLLASLRRRLAALSAGPPGGTVPASGAGLEAGAGLPAGQGQRADPELVFFQHDEVIVHCPAALAGQVAAAAADAAREATRLLFGATPVSFPMTTAIVTCYADAK